MRLSYGGTWKGKRVRSGGGGEGSRVMVIKSGGGGGLKAVDV